MAVHANSLANLRTIPPEHRANGRSMGASITEWMNRLDDRDDQQLSDIMADQKAPRSKRLAAQSLLRASLMDFAKNGKPLAADDLDRILDRTHGRAVQRVEVTQKEERDPAALTLELMQLLAEHPELSQALAGDVAQAQLPAGGDAVQEEDGAGAGG